MDVTTETIPSDTNPMVGEETGAEPEGCDGNRGPAGAADACGSNTAPAGAVSRHDRLAVIAHCYLSYFISGMLILIFGVILPYLIEERGISFTAAGGLLSFLAIGNLLASVVYPLFCTKLSQKRVTVMLSVIYPVCLFLFTTGVPVAALYAMIFLIGITKGMITIVNNHAVKQVTGNSNKYLNLLHMWYAVGALLSPFIISIFTAAGISWKVILKILSLFAVLVVLSYSTMDFTKLQGEEVREGKRRSGGVSPAGGEKQGRSFRFITDAGFLLSAGLIFFYMGLENAVNGWFVTYLKSTGLMSMAVSTIMVSVTWLMIMIGRILVAGVPQKVKPAYILAVISLIQFVSIVMLVKARTPSMVVASLVVMGLGMAGTFPTTMAFVGDCMGASPLGMSIMTGIGSFGGIITPQLIGVLADHFGFGAAILFLLFDGVLLLLCGVLTVPASRKRRRERGSAGQRDRRL